MKGVEMRTLYIRILLAMSVLSFVTQSTLAGKIIFVGADDSVTNVPNPLTQPNTVLDAASGPWYVASDLSVPSDKILTIEPGTTVYFNQDVRLTVQGRLVAEGTEFERIRLMLQPGSSATEWDGIRFENTSEDNRLCYVDMEHCSGASRSVDLYRCRVLLDNVIWGQTNNTTLQIEESSAIVRNCVFPENTRMQTVVGHRLLSSDPYLVFENNVLGFNSSPNKDDVVDFTTSGSSVVPRFINNVFLGGGDDALDLDGTNGYVEGNVFMNFHRDFDPSEGEAYGVSTGYDAGHSSNHVIVRNLFINCDHAALVKDQSWINFVNNTVVNCSVGINFDEPSEAGIDPGRGAYLDGNIFWNTPTPLAQFYVDDPEWGTTDITVNHSIVGSEWHYLGQGNIDADPCFADPGYWDANGTPEDANDDFWVGGDYHLKSQAGRWDPNTQSWVQDNVNSPCIDAGDPNSDWTGELWPHGKRINMGAYGGTPEASMSSLTVGNIADLNNDDIANLRDFAWLADSWQAEKALLPEDLNRDKQVNSKDLSIFTDNWLWEQ